MIYDTRFMSPAQEFLRKNLFSAVDLSCRIIYIVKKMSHRHIAHGSLAIALT